MALGPVRNIAEKLSEHQLPVRKRILTHGTLLNRANSEAVRLYRWSGKCVGALEKLVAVVNHPEAREGENEAPTDNAVRSRLSPQLLQTFCQAYC